MPKFSLQHLILLFLLMSYCSITEANHLIDFANHANELGKQNKVNNRYNNDTIHNTDSAYLKSSHYVSPFVSKSVNIPTTFNYFVSTSGDNSNPGTESEPFRTIQYAIDNSASGYAIKVLPGDYMENLNFKGKSIKLVGSPSNPENTVIDGGNNGTVITMTKKENTNTLVCGFVLENGNTTSHGGAIYLFDNARPVLSNLIIRNNTAGAGGAISARHNGDPTLRNVLIYNNTATVAGAIYTYNYSEVYLTNVTIANNNTINESNSGIMLQRNATVYFNNCIIWTPQEANEITFSSSSSYNGNCTANISYTNIRGGENGNIDLGNSNYTMTVNWNSGSINSEPLFRNLQNDNYLLLSTSPCIDAGNPSSNYNDKNFPPSQGSLRNDMGVFGGPDAWQAATEPKIIVIPVSGGGNLINSNGGITYMVGHKKHILGSPGSTKSDSEEPKETEITDEAEKYMITVFPNPASEEVTIKVEKYEPNNLSYQVYNAFGKKVIENMVQDNETVIPLLSLEPSIYIINILDHNKTVRTIKIIKQ